jgi:hypothetical protein
MNDTFNESKYQEDLNTKHQQLQTDLQELQVVETYLFDELRKVNQSTDNDRDAKKEEINTRIHSLKSVRTTLLTNLRNLYTNVSGEISYNSRHLENQKDMSDHLTRELNSAEQQLKNLKAEKNNKTRLAQVGEYEFEKNIEHRSILKTIVYSSFFILGFTFLNHKNILPKMITKVLIVIIVAFSLLLLIQRFFWNFRRDNIDYSKFKQMGTTPPKIVGEKKNTLSVRKMLGLNCEQPTLQQLAQQKSNLKNRKANPSEGFTNYGSILPRQSCCLKSNCKQNVTNTNSLSFSLI